MTTLDAAAGSLNIVEAVAHRARTAPSHPAIRDEDRALDYAGLAAAVARMAGWLQAQGIGRGDMVALQLMDDTSFPIAFLGVAQIGAVVLPIDWKVPDHELTRMLAAFGPRLALLRAEAAMPAGCTGVVLDEVSAEIDAAPPAPIQRMHWDDPCHIILSSGSTGAPKGMVITHGQQMMRFLGLTQALGRSRDNRYLSAVPLCFSAGRNFLLYHLLGGGSVTFQPPLFSAPEYVAAVAAAEATFTLTVPTVGRWLLDQPASVLQGLATLKTLIVAAAPLSAEDKLALLSRVSPAFHEVYGASGAGVIALLTPEETRLYPDSIGRPIFPIEAEVVDEAEQPVARGTPGRLRIRGPSLSTRFQGVTPTETAESFRGGWYYPGEIATIDDAGYIRLKGRASSLIIRGGINIHPEEVEAALMAHPAVAEAGATGMPSADYGEEVRAFVVLRQPVEVGDLILHCRTTLVAYKVPREIIVVPALPKTTTNKLSRPGLKTLA